MCIDIDEELLREVMRSGGFPTKKAAVDSVLRLLLRSCSGEKEKPRVGEPKHARGSF